MLSCLDANLYILEVSRCSDDQADLASLMVASGNPGGYVRPSERDLWLKLRIVC